VVVDEAAVVGTRKLGRLLDHAKTGGTKVVLVGDHYQLPEIDAGGAFAGLARRLNASQLLENRRQIHAWERGALTELRGGDAHAAFDTYQQHGHVHSSIDAEQIREQLVRDWWAARSRGQTALMIAARHHDVEDLNQRARQFLTAAGHLGPDQLDVGGRRFAVGDEILAGRNDYRLGVLNGTHATITNIDPQNGVLRTETGDRELVLPFDYIAAGHLTHAYATTVHKAQGRTVDESFVLADGGLDRQRAYTALSRGTQRNTLYVTDAPDDRDEHRHAPEAANDAVAQARAELARMSTPTMATDQLAIPPPDIGPSLEL
jgi:ATP-dependent exoDNAse (exonuclease V) alpha subunit